MLIRSAAVENEMTIPHEEGAFDSARGIHFAERARRKIRVLFIIDQLSVLGGGERAMFQMIRGLSANFSCRVVTFRKDVHPEVRNLSDVPVTVLPIRRTLSLDGIRAAFELARLIRRERVDIVHTFFETADLFGGIVAKLAKRVVLISSRRDMGLLRSRKHGLAYWLVGKMCSRVLTVSQAVRSQVLKDDRLKPNRVTTHYTGVQFAPAADPHVLAEMKRRLDIPADVPVVLTVANILPWKGHHEFLEAASRVREKFPQTHFLVAGAPNDGLLLAALQKRCAELGLDRCLHYLGEVRPIAPLYQIASVFCLLSKTEGLPNVVLEAMAAGTPVVATRVGGTGELVAHGISGMLVEPGFSDDAAARICELLSAPEFAERLAERARSRALNMFTIDRMIKSLEEIYYVSLAE